MYTCLTAIRHFHGLKRQKTKEWSICSNALGQRSRRPYQLLYPKKELSGGRESTGTVQSVPYCPPIITLLLLLITPISGQFLTDRPWGAVPQALFFICFNYQMAIVRRSSKLIDAAKCSVSPILIYTCKSKGNGKQFGSRLPK